MKGVFFKQRTQILEIKRMVWAKNIMDTSKYYLCDKIQELKDRTY